MPSNKKFLCCIDAKTKCIQDIGLQAFFRGHMKTPKENPENPVNPV